jgi:transketolase
MRMNKIPCRRAITGKLLELAKKDSHIFVVTSDARGSVTLNEFAEELPDQFVEVGIAEQNAVGIGSGLALTGKKVFVCGPACFYSARSLEQIKVDVAYTGAAVKIIGVSGGVSYGALGSSHHSLHDIAVMRTFPGLNVYLPSDRHQAGKLIEHLVDSDEAAYVRVGRDPVPDIYSDTDRFIPGKCIKLSDGKDITLVATGEMVYHALMAGEELRKKGIHATVLDMHTLKPFDERALIEAAKDTGHVLTIEEHSIYGGLGGKCAEVLSQNYPVKMKILGIPDENAVHGKAADVFDYYSLTGRGITVEAEKLLGKKLVSKNEMS